MFLLNSPKFFAVLIETIEKCICLIQTPKTFLLRFKKFDLEKTNPLIVGLMRITRVTFTRAMCMSTLQEIQREPYQSKGNEPKTLFCL